MTLRVLLVGLVASLGLELPSGLELSCWTQAGRDWADARLNEFSAYRADAERVFLGTDPVEGAPPEVVDAASENADLAFDVVVEGMAATFAAELAEAREVAPIPEPAPSLLVESGVTETPTPRAGVAPEPVDSPALESPSPSRGDQFTSAIRLTRQAVGAWASLIVGATESLVDSR